MSGAKKARAESLVASSDISENKGVEGAQSDASTEHALTLLKQLKVGDVAKGVIKRKAEDRLLIDLGGIEAILRLEEMSWGDLGYSRQIFESLKLDEELTAKVIRIDRKRKVVEVGLKQLQPNPWIEFAAAHPIDSSVVGQVTLIFGRYAVISFGKGVESFLDSFYFVPEHLRSEYPNVDDYLKTGDFVEGIVTAIDPEAPKLSLRFGPQEFAKFDKRIAKRQHADQDMDIEVKGVIRAAQILRDASKEALRKGLSLADLDVANTREIANMFRQEALLQSTRHSGPTPESSPVATLLNAVQDATSEVTEGDEVLDGLVERLNVALAAFNKAGGDIDESSKATLIAQLNELKAKRPLMTLLTAGTEVIPAGTKVSLSFKSASKGYPSGRFVMTATSKDEHGQQPTLARVHNLPIRLSRQAE